jgi:hypothetical protein
MNWLAAVACASVGSRIALGMGGIRSVVPADGVSADSLLRGVPEGEDDEDDEEQKKDEEEDEEDEEDQGEGYSE